MYDPNPAWSFLEYTADNWETEDGEPWVFTPEQVRAIIDACQGARVRPEVQHTPVDLSALPTFDEIKRRCQS
jgi:hypothetical protein